MRLRYLGPIYASAGCEIMGIDGHYVREDQLVIPRIGSSDAIWGVSLSLSGALTS